MWTENMRMPIPIVYRAIFLIKMEALRFYHHVYTCIARPVLYYELPHCSLGRHLWVGVERLRDPPHPNNPAKSSYFLTDWRLSDLYYVDH